MNPPSTADAVSARMKAVSQRCRTGSSELELWPHYYETRYLELCSIVGHWPTAPGGKILEIGCGMGYVSALLAQLADKVYATDLPEKNAQQHAIGIDKTASFLQRMAIANVETRSLDAEDMHFRDDMFDIVFSMFVIQHISDRPLAASEMARVLKPGGYAIHLVPSRVSLIYGFAAYWVYLVKRSVVHLIRLTGLGGKSTGLAGALDQRTAGETVRSSGQFANFPLQPVLGMYETLRREWVESGRVHWEGLLSSHGTLQPLRTVSITLNPLPLIVRMFAPGLAVTLSVTLRRVDRFLGRLPVLRQLGTDHLVILQKPDHSALRPEGE